MNTYKLTATDRRVINKFLLSVADEMEFSTNCIRQPLSLEKLEIAFKEVENKAKKRIEETRSLLTDFDNGNLPLHLKSYFGDDVKREDVALHIEQVVLQENYVVKSIKNNYTVSVVNDFFDDATARDLHLSFNPRVTFGYSNQLHEECRVALTPSLRELFSKSQLCKQDKINAELFSYGAFTIDKIACSYYEDTKFFINGKCIMATISHEQIYNLSLSNDLLIQFLNFENKKDRNQKIIAKITT